MNLDNWNDRKKFVWDLIDYIEHLYVSMAYDPYSDKLDLYHMASVKSNLYWLYDSMNVEANFGKALSEMFKTKTSDDDEKLIFPLQKAFNEFMSSNFRMQSLVHDSRTLQFNDYRVQNFQSELRQKIEMLRDWYKEHYELND